MKVSVRSIIVCVVAWSSILLAQVPDSVKVEYRAFGYYPTAEYDTVKVVVAVQDFTSHIIALPALAVREKYSYHGDPMPPGNYDDRWVIKSYLYQDKTPLDQGIVWMSKEVKQ